MKRDCYRKYIRKISRRTYSQLKKEFSRHQSERMKGNWAGEKNPFAGSARFGELNPMFGKHRSDKDKAAVSRAQKGKVISPEVRKKISLGVTGTIRSAESKILYSKSKTAEKNPRFNPKIYDFHHPVYGTFTCNRAELRNMFPEDNLNIQELAKIANTKKTYKDWEVSFPSSADSS